MKTKTFLLVGLLAIGAASLVREARAKDSRPTPEWVLPVDTARAIAKRERKPLLIISLNGNLDGNC